MNHFGNYYLSRAGKISMETALQMPPCRYGEFRAQSAPNWRFPAVSMERTAKSALRFDRIFVANSGLKLISVGTGRRN